MPLGTGRAIQEGLRVTSLEQHGPLATPSVPVPVPVPVEQPHAEPPVIVYFERAGA